MKSKKLLSGHPLQVRCMAAVLLMVGRGEEQPEIVQTLLDTQQCPRKPQFAMASGAEVAVCLDQCLGDRVGSKNRANTWGRTGLGAAHPATLKRACSARRHSISLHCDCSVRRHTTASSLHAIVRLASSVPQRSRCCCTAATTAACVSGAARPTTAWFARSWRRCSPGEGGCAVAFWLTMLGLCMPGSVAAGGDAHQVRGAPLHS